MQSNLKDGSNLHPSHRHRSRLSSSIEPKHSKARHGKRNFNENHDKQKVIPELTGELLELIVKRLDVVGFCAFGGVCKSWLEICDRSKEAFLESQAPMVVLISPHAKRACYLYDMANGKTRKVMLPNLVGKFFVGCSAGYMIIEDKNHHVSLINPLTGHELKCDTTPSDLTGKYIHDRIILSSTLSSRGYAILAICHDMHEFRFYDSRNGNWYAGQIYGQPWVDLVIFKDQLYIVTKKAQFGTLRIKAANPLESEFTWLKVKNTPKVNSYDLRLVVSDNQLLMIDFVPEKHLNIYKMDFNAMEWVKQGNLGDQALFFGGKWGSAIRKPGNWGGRSNCVYHLGTLSTVCCIYSMEAKLIDKFPLVENPTTSKLCSHGWYYPHQCMKVDYLMDA